ncbi:hypothetical protein RI129_002953 [Pyrocoelia pectoralis]|uniref:MADF domain-containing protein n=1 Tax=Pyrocoelia pectoralis TaxID=417401 RepID=A0AAN7VMX9_9COLE
MDKQFITELLELYAQLPAVSNINSVEYKNKILKSKSYEKLIKKCQEYEPNADRSFVTKKINSLRTNFRKEHNKKIKSVENDAEVYVPRLWYYNLLLFTCEQHKDKSEDSLSSFQNEEQATDKDTKRTVQSVDDIHGGIGKNVAHKLRGMRNEQKIIAEKIINDVLYHGQLNNLSVVSHLQL